RTGPMPRQASEPLAHAAPGVPGFESSTADSPQGHVPANEEPATASRSRLARVPSTLMVPYISRVLEDALRASVTSSVVCRPDARKDRSVHYRILAAARSPSSAAGMPAFSRAPHSAFRLKSPDPPRRPEASVSEGNPPLPPQLRQQVRPALTLARRIDEGAE